MRQASIKPLRITRLRPGDRRVAVDTDVKTKSPPKPNLAWAGDELLLLAYLGLARLLTTIDETPLIKRRE